MEQRPRDRDGRDQADLVERARRGDRRAFEQLVDQYDDRILNYVSRMLGDRTEAQDVAQETFVRAYEALPSFRGAASFQTWLYRIASNLAIDAARARRRRGNTVSLQASQESGGGELLLDLPDERTGPEEWALGDELQRTVQQAILKLSPKLRAVVILYDLQGLTYEQIARVVGCPVGTVKSRLFNARAQLKEALERELGSDSVASP